MNETFEQEIRYRLLKILSNSPKLTQREMAKRMGISLGKVNYCLSEMGDKGFIKIKHFQMSRNRIKYLYLLTPQGLEERASLALRFLKRKIVEYGEIKKQIRELTREVEEERLADNYREDTLDVMRRGH